MNPSDYFKEIPRRLQQGATLAELHAALADVSDQRLWEPTPARLRRLATTWTQYPDFVPLRLREVAEGIELTHDDDYVLAMVGALGVRSTGGVREPMLRLDHTLREDVFWRVFEVEGGGEISLANVDKYSATEATWHTTVLTLVADGTLDRARVLRCCLEALNRDFAAFRAGWFSRTYTALAPTEQEAAANQNLLILCLASTVTATVSFAVTQLAALHKAGLLDDAAFVAASGGGFTASKAAATSVVRILNGVVSRGTVPDEDSAHALVASLAHPHADVQTAGVKALAALGRTDLVRDNADLLVPSVAASVGGSAVVGVPDVVQTDAAWQGDSAEADSEPTLPPAQPVLPWRDEDALERFSTLLETANDALELELACTWLTTSDRVGDVLEPLRKRAFGIDVDPEDSRSWIAALVRAALDPTEEFLPQRVFQSWSTVEVDGELVTRPYGKARPLPTEEEMTTVPSLVARLRHVVAMAQGRTARHEVLATPTDTHGWLDADTLLDRYERARVIVGEHSVDVNAQADLAQAVLRVRPEDRERVSAATGCTPARSGAVRIEFRARESRDRKPDGSPAHLWWRIHVEAEPAAANLTTQPGLVETADSYDKMTTPLVASTLRLLDPSSTLPLAGVAVRVLDRTLSEVNHAAEPVLRGLAAHPGTWSSATAQVVALGMAAKGVELRAQAAELLASAVPTRIDAATAAEGFFACAPGIVLTRWTSSFADAATLNQRAVIGVLTALLPEFDPKTRGIGALSAVLLDELLRSGGNVSEPALREWLAQFKGSSAAAKVARALLALG